MVERKGREGKRNGIGKERHCDGYIMEFCINEMIVLCISFSEVEKLVHLFIYFLSN